MKWIWFLIKQLRNDNLYDFLGSFWPVYYYGHFMCPFWVLTILIATFASNPYDEVIDCFLKKKETHTTKMLGFGTEL